MCWASSCASLAGAEAACVAGCLPDLPTEAEWEYACRGPGAVRAFHFGDSISSRLANFDGNYPEGGADKGSYLMRPCKVGSYGANRFGLHDVHGNVWEWCRDWYQWDYYVNSPKRDPLGPERGTARVCRGGSFSDQGAHCRTASRHKALPATSDKNRGFRVVLVELRGRGSGK